MENKFRYRMAFRYVHYSLLTHLNEKAHVRMRFLFRFKVSKDKTNCENSFLCTIYDKTRCFHPYSACLLRIIEKGLIGKRNLFRHRLKQVPILFQLPISLDKSWLQMCAIVFCRVDGTNGARGDTYVSLVTDKNH